MFLKFFGAVFISLFVAVSLGYIPHVLFDNATVTFTVMFIIYIVCFEVINHKYLVE